jgi:outer membrane protein OmpA-like peptidoglycan-associated protein
MSKKRTLIFLMMMTLLSACSHFNEERTNEFQSLSQLQQAQYWQARKVKILTERLEKMSVVVYHFGDEYQILIPANFIFKGNTSQMASPRDELFKAIADLVNAQSTPAVNVLAYANNSASPQRNFSLTQNWAETVVDQLRQQGLSVSLVTAKGHGSCDNIGRGSSLTDRIEVHYRISHEN